MNESDKSHVAIDLKELLVEKIPGSKVLFSSGNLFEWLNKESSGSLMMPNCLVEAPIKIDSFTEGVCSVGISMEGNQVACGTDNCQVKVFAVATGKLLRVFQGHSGRIIQVNIKKINKQRGQKKQDTVIASS